MVSVRRRWPGPARSAAAIGLALWLPAVAGAAVGGCWVDVFAEPGLKGATVRLEGPVELPSLQSVSDANWNDEIDSLEVGPAAEVTVYRNPNFEVPQAPVNHPDALRMWNMKREAYRKTVQTFYPGHRIRHLGEFELHGQISSLKLVCVNSGKIEKK